MIRPWARRSAVALLAVGGGLALAVVPATPASAHPLGNFTVNTADRIVITREGVDLLHVVDLAEIPTVQLRARADTNGDGTLSPEELTAYAAVECGRSASALVLVVDGNAATLSLRTAKGEAREGQAGLKTTRLECDFTSAGRPASSVSLSDSSAANRVGWKEITAVAGCGSLVRSDVPTASPSALLNAYPIDELRSPLNVRSAQLSVSRSGPCVGNGAGPAAQVVPRILPRGADVLTTAFTNFVGRDHLSLPLGLLAVVLSVAFGCAHALAPGHGKTVIAAYLVGQRGTKRQALWLGTTVTVAHTASVLALGAVLSLGTLAAPERVIPATEVLSGLLLAGLGIWLLVGASRRLRRSAAHDHGDHPDHSAHPHPPEDHPHPHADHADHSDHPHPHRHPHPDLDHAAVAVRERAPAAVHDHGGRAHSHAPLDDRPLGWRSLAAMGVAGGLVPSPSALIVLLGATALGRAAFGILLVIGYGIGMALTLTAAGLLLLRGQALAARRGWNGRRAMRVSRLLPVLTAGVVVLVGAVLVTRGVASGLLF